MYKIEISLDKDFENLLNQFKNNYSEKLFDINGLSTRYINYNNFIDNFIDTVTVADSSVDSSSNVAHRDMPTLMSEMSKPHKKLLSYNKIYYEIKKKYGKENADKWFTNEFDGHLYLHDASSASYISYCYKPEELITVKYNDKMYSSSFKEIYNLIEDKEEYDETVKKYVKYPKNLYIQDLDNNHNIVWTKVRRFLYHENDKPMRVIKCANGFSQIITEDHPIITKYGDIAAKEVELNSILYTVKPNYFTDSIDTITINGIQIHLTNELGWLTGIVLTEGSSHNYCVSIFQNEGKIYNKIKNILDRNQIPYSIDNRKNMSTSVFRLLSSPFQKYLYSFTVNRKADNKILPSDYIHYSYDFLDGIVAGLIDGDSSLSGYKNRQGVFYVTSETLTRQISAYLNTKNIFCGNRTPFRYESKYNIKQKLPLFGFNFLIASNESYFMNIGSIKITERYIPRIRSKGTFSNKKYKSNFDESCVIDNIQYIDGCNIVYDITTESGHFLCNNILSHNCFAYDLTRLAEEGLFFLKGGNFNPEPARHLGTFVDFVKEFVSFASNRTSGAVGLPNLIVYMFYFWKLDVDNHYIEYDKYRFAKQQIQRLIYSLNQPYVRDYLYIVL